MKLTIDTKEDSHEDLRKVISMLQNIVGDSQEIFTNQPGMLPSQAQESSPIANIFGDIFASSIAQNSSDAASAETSAPETSVSSEETSQSTEDLFAELFSEEELKKMDIPKEEEAEPKDKKYSIELY